MEIFLGWIIFSLVVGFVGSDRKIGFGGAFFLSLLLSPIIGLIVTLVSKNIKDEEYKRRILKAQQKQQEALNRLSSKSISTSNTSIIEELEKLKKLKDSDVITEEEFLKLKKKLLDSSERIESSIQNEHLENYVKFEKLKNGRILQFINEKDSSTLAKVRINDKIPEDGFYRLSESNVVYRVIKGEVIAEFYIINYKQKDGKEIELGQFIGTNRLIGCPVWLNDKVAPDGNYKIGFLSSINVVNGVVDSLGF